MPAAQHNFTIEQGATTVKPFIWKSSDGSAINLTGYTARMQVRRNYASADVLLEATTENGRLQIEPSAGRITLVLSAEVTAGLTWRNGVYDIEMVSSDGHVTRLLQGEIEISKEVTRG